MRRHEPGLVALDRADAMPLQRQVAQQGDLFDCFLDVVLAESALSRGAGLTHHFAVEGFRHRQQRDFVHIAVGTRTGQRDPLVNALEVGCNRGHN
jgi:hypothetical protein